MLRRHLWKGIAAIGGSTGLLQASGAAGGKKQAAKEKQSVKQFVETEDGTALFFRDWGTGKPMVFVAPWALNSRWWEIQMFRLTEEGIRCVAFDRRGHGRSGQPDRGYDFDTLADDMTAVMEKLDLHDVTLVGH